MLRTADRLDNLKYLHSFDDTLIMARDHDGETALCLASRCASKTSAPPRLPHLVLDAANEISSWEDRDEKISAILGQLDMEYKLKQVHTITV